MRRFEVHLDKQLAGIEPSTELVEMPDDATDAACEEACQECLDTMIGNELDTGWYELARAPKATRAREVDRRIANLHGLTWVGEAIAQYEEKIDAARTLAQEPKGRRR